MRKRLMMVCLCTAFSVNASTAPERWTFETANESAKKNSPTYQREISGNAITTQMGNDDWKHYAKPPVFGSGGGDVERVYTLLWQSNLQHGHDRGDIRLNQSFRDFDEIVSIGGNDGDGYIQHYRFTPTEYDIAYKLSGRRGSVSLYERDSVSWNGQFTSDTYFKTKSENGRLYKVFGVTFN